MDLPIRWQAYEYEEKDRSGDWYWALGIIAVAAAVTSILFENFLFALVILIGSFTLALFASKKPELVNYSVERRGVRVNHTLYPFSTLDAFWIAHDDTNDVHTLLLRSKKVMMPYIIVPLTHDHIEMVHRALSEVLEEEEMSEPVAERFLNYFGF